MDDSAASAFNLTAREYDRARRQLVPCFDDFYRAAVELIPFSCDRAIRVLDLGCGTGLLAGFVAEAFPCSELTLVDLAPEMLRLARERMAPVGGRVRFIVSDYSREPIEGVFDAIVSALSIHHLSHPDKRVLFARIHAALASGGVFVNAEQVIGPTAETERRNRAQWMREVRERGVGDADLAAAIERMEHDIPAPLDAQMKWLEAAGFRDVDCVYKSGMFAVYGGFR
jgi:tRNA (cmo5U34)-methyltransferase